MATEPLAQPTAMSVAESQAMQVHTVFWGRASKAGRSNRTTQKSDTTLKRGQ